MLFHILQPLTVELNVARDCHNIMLLACVGLGSSRCRFNNDPSTREVRCVVLQDHLQALLSEVCGNQCIYSCSANLQRFAIHNHIGQMIAKQLRSAELSTKNVSKQPKNGSMLTLKCVLWFPPFRTCVIELQNLAKSIRNQPIKRKINALVKIIRLSLIPGLYLSQRP